VAVGDRNSSYSSIEQLVAGADQAMLEAKQTGRNRICASNTMLARTLKQAHARMSPGKPAE
jgi:hypothetical protein